MNCYTDSDSCKQNLKPQHIARYGENCDKHRCPFRADGNDFYVQRYGFVFSETANVFA